MIETHENIPSVSATKTRVAAFFDIDGTLLAGPSLERRLFANLRYRRTILTTNYLHWLAHSRRGRTFCSWMNRSVPSMPKFAWNFVAHCGNSKKTCV